MVDYLIGVDGGGSGTRVLVQRSSGALVGSGEAGPSALGQGVVKAWRNIELAVRAAFDQGSVALPGWAHCALAAGLSGVTRRPLREAFQNADPGLARLELESDAFAMLLGAHGGQPGVILIAGTGSIAEALRADGSRATVGGWGFPVGDEGSGAWLGLQAVHHAQAAMDGRVNAGTLSRRVWMHCGDERDSLQDWCAGAGQFEYAQLARAVFDCEATDPFAAALLLRAVEALEDLTLAIDPRGRLPVAAAGSIAERLAPRMRPALRNRLVPAKENAVAGALTLIRQAVSQETEEAV